MSANGSHLRFLLSKEKKAMSRTWVTARHPPENPPAHRLRMHSRQCRSPTPLAVEAACSPTEAVLYLSWEPRGTRKLDRVSDHSIESLPGCAPPSRTSGLATRPALTNEMWAEGAVTFRWKCLPFLPARTTGHVPVWSCPVTGPHKADSMLQSCSRPFKNTQKQWEVSLCCFFLCP